MELSEDQSCSYSEMKMYGVGGGLFTSELQGNSSYARTPLHSKWPTQVTAVRPENVFPGEVSGTRPKHVRVGHHQQFAAKDHLTKDGIHNQVKI